MVRPRWMSSRVLRSLLLHCEHDNSTHFFLVTPTHLSPSWLHFSRLIATIELGDIIAGVRINCKSQIQFR